MTAFRPSAALRGLDDAGVHFVLTGDLAARWHGLDHVTPRVEVCHDPAADNVEVEILLALRDAITEES
ncbi:MAG: hypothetical protein QOE45_2674 [Frankiaceae bacterium]|nr:hypothetical protein [Frankiaceae bacterium]